MMALLHIADLAVTIDQRIILSGIAFSCAPGEFIGLIGPNGSGKSTLLKAIVGYQAFHKGSIALNNQSVCDIGMRDRARQVAYVPQDTSGINAITALEIIEMGRYPHIGRIQALSKNDHDAITDAITQADVEQLGHRSLETLSGGERQRVLIARALAQRSDLLLLDEPTANLDLKHQIDVFDLLKRLTANGKAAIVACHDLALVARYCSRVLVLDKGQLLHTGPPRDVLNEELFHRVFGVRASLATDAITGLPYVTPVL